LITFDDELIDHAGISKFEVRQIPALFVRLRAQRHLMQVNCTSTHSSENKKEIPQINQLRIRRKPVAVQSWNYRSWVESGPLQDPKRLEREGRVALIDCGLFQRLK
jgi:hypothetical protein